LVLNLHPENPTYGTSGTLGTFGTYCCCPAEVCGAGGTEKVMLVYIISSHV
jgi:hypothetical protein